VYFLNQGSQQLKFVLLLHLCVNFLGLVLMITQLDSICIFLSNRGWVGGMNSTSEIEFLTLICHIFVFILRSVNYGGKKMSHQDADETLRREIV
jgi:hypothetical protein